MAVPKKPNGEIRVCIDSQVLNKALMRDITTFILSMMFLQTCEDFMKFDVKKRTGK